MTKDRPQKSWDYYSRLRLFGVFVLTTFGIIAGARDDISKALLHLRGELTIADRIQEYSAFLLLIVTIYLIMSWIWNTEKELRMMRNWLEDFVPPRVGTAFPITILLAIFLAILTINYRKIEWYAALFGVFKTIELFALWVRNCKLRSFLSQAIERSPSSADRAAWDAIEEYYIRRPQEPLAGVQILGCVFVFMVMYATGKSSAHSDAVRATIGYSLLITMIVGNLVIYTRWRSHRDASLAALIELQESEAKTAGNTTATQS